MTTNNNQQLSEYYTKIIPNLYQVLLVSIQQTITTILSNDFNCYQMKLNVAL